MGKAQNEWNDTEGLIWKKKKKYIVHGLGWYCLLYKRTSANVDSLLS